MNTHPLSPGELAAHYRMEAAAAWACANFPDLSQLACHKQVIEAMRRGLDLHLFNEHHLRQLTLAAGGRITRLTKVAGHWIALIFPAA